MDARGNCELFDISSKNEASTLFTGIQSGYRHTQSDTMISDVVTSSHSDKRRTRSATKATKAILDFDGCLFLRQPKLGCKAMISMLAGSEAMEFEKACTSRECTKALLEAYEGTEVFSFEFSYELPERHGDRNCENPEEPECTGLE